MCFHTELKADAATLKKRFDASFPEEQKWQPTVFNGFQHPMVPIITNADNVNLNFAQWGLLPTWAKDVAIQNQTLNARLETLPAKPSFQPYVQQRCIIPATGFFEWHWHDTKGKHKTKYYITVPHAPIYTYAGLFNVCAHPVSGQLLPTFTIITTAANELMSHIHNTKKRMPIILLPHEEELWLHQGQLAPMQARLQADQIANKNGQQTFLNF